MASTASPLGACIISCVCKYIRYVAETRATLHIVDHVESELAPCLLTLGTVSASSGAPSGKCTPSWKENTCTVYD